MRKLYVAFAILAFIHGDAQQWKWAYAIHAINQAGVKKIETDSAGNAYLSGYSQDGPLFANSSAGTYSVNNMSSFLLKYSPAGNLDAASGMWSQSKGLKFFIMDYSTDKEGNTFVTGGFGGPDTVHFGSGTDTITRITTTANSFNGKLGNDGKGLWLSESSYSCSMGGIFVQSFNSNYVVEIGAYGSCDVEEPQRTYIKKRDAGNATQQWEMPGSFFHTSNYTTTHVVKTKDDGFLVHGYYSYGAAPFAGLTNTIVSPPSTDKTDTYLVKYDLQGQVVWLKTINGMDHQFSGMVAVDGNNDIIFSVYSDDTCYFGSTMLLPVAGRTSHLIKADQNGNYIRHISFNADGWMNLHVYDIKTDHLNNVFITTTMDTTFAIGPNTVYSYQGPNKIAGAIIKLDPLFNYKWSEYVSGCCNIYGQVALKDSMIYYAASYSGTITLNNSLYTFTTATGPNKTSLFIAAMRNDTPLNTGIKNYQSPVLNLFPNPASGQLTIYSEKDPIVQIKIFSVSGLLALSQSSGGTAETVIDISQLEAGIYILQARTQKELLYRKVVIE